ncbi:MAG TPA: BlaI/MecI/CopY family transcriptional regulator [Vicinamibacterales bacterium]|nr:BlaI/MecI/CopY family transcriptional regulator [Vicinamibacterales bacterium]
MARFLLGMLSRRERQIMDILFRRGRATADDVMHELSGKPAFAHHKGSELRRGRPSYSTVRTQLRVLEEKGHVRHEEEGRRFIYTPVMQRSAARKSALRHVVDTFFDGSVEKVVAALLGGEAARLSDEELRRIAELIAKTRKDGAE